MEEMMIAHLVNLQKTFVTWHLVLISKNFVRGQPLCLLMFGICDLSSFILLPFNISLLVVLSPQY